jgi:hypothetical protein
MATKPGRQLAIFTRALRSLVDKSTDAKAMKALGNEAVTIIVRRTRLGKTARRTRVTDELGNIKNRVQRLKSHSPQYRRFRKDHQDILGQFTRWNRSNLTFSDQLLASVGVRKVTKRQVTVAATGRRTPVFPGRKEPSNPRLAEIVTEQGRPFLELSTLDDKKLVRFYRRQFGDLQRRFGKKL